MKKLLSILLCTVLIMSCVSCKNEKDSISTSTNAPDTIIDPSTINWGYDENEDKSERWYLTDTDDVIYIYFTQGSESELCTYNLVKSGVVKESAACVVTEDNHLVPKEGEEASFDLVFEDAFNAYDYSTDSIYSRGDISEYNSYFSGRVYYSEDNLSTVTFNSDFTCTKTCNDSSVTGTWEITAKTSLLCNFETSIIVYTINYNDDFTVKSIETDDEIFYSEYEEDETVNKYKAY